jgi:Alpha/beta hydrolase domain
MLEGYVDQSGKPRDAFVYALMHRESRGSMVVAGGPLGFLVGVCEPFDAATLARLYPGGKREYLNKFEASLSSAMAAGFILCRRQTGDPGTGGDRLPRLALAGTDFLMVDQKVA